MNKLFVSLLFVCALGLYGCGSTTNFVNVNQKNAFETKDVLTEGRFGHAAVGFGDHIYIFGGQGKGGYLKKIEKFNIKTGKSEILDCEITPRRYLSAVEHDGKIYILGGNKIVKIDNVTNQFHNKRKQELKSVAFLEVFDPSTGTVKRLKDMPDCRKKPGLVAKDGKLYVIGGSKDHLPYWDYDSGSIETEIGLEFFSTVFIYDIRTDTWTEGSNMDFKKECNAVLSDNNIYVIGGYDGYATNSVEVYDIEKNSWETLEDAPFDISANSTVIKDNRIYIFGDYEELNRVATYDIKSKEWEKINSNFQHSRHQAAVVQNENIYIIGGNRRLVKDLRFEFLDYIQKYTVK